MPACPHCDSPTLEIVHRIRTERIDAQGNVIGDES